MSDHKYAILGIVLLVIVMIIGWHGMPDAVMQSGTSTPAERQSREAVIISGQRIPIDTPRIKGSLALKGARVDDVSFRQYRETVDPTSPTIVLLSPLGSLHPFYAEFGWIGAAAAGEAPGPDTVWRQEGSGSLEPGRPVTLIYDNREGLVFRRTIAIDEQYLIVVKDEVANRGPVAVTLYPYGLISRHGTPQTSPNYLLHEGLIGVLGDRGEQRLTYKSIEDKGRVNFDVTNAWMGITDKYWAAALLPNTHAHVRAEFSGGTTGSTNTYQTVYVLDALLIAPGATGVATGRLFAGAKEVAVVGINFPIGDVGGYNKQLGLNKFDLLIDWGWFYFITKPLFLFLDQIFKWTGNFGVAILIVTVIIKFMFVPFANKSYRSMIEIQRLEPQIASLRERFLEKERANIEIIELYKREKITAPSGCLPNVIQILVYFLLSKVLNVTVEMRYAPFFGWIHDLNAPDPTNVFNLFGLLPWEPTTVPLIGDFLHVGVWPMIAGLTFWQIQKKVSLIEPGSFQRVVYMFLPLLAVMSLVAAWVAISYTVYNVLSTIHLSILMGKNRHIGGDISGSSAKLLPYGKIQPIVFLTMLAPSASLLLLFWRRSKRPRTERQKQPLST